MEARDWLGGYCSCLGLHCWEFNTKVEQRRENQDRNYFKNGGELSVVIKLGDLVSRVK